MTVNSILRKFAAYHINIINIRYYQAHRTIDSIFREKAIALELFGDADAQSYIFNTDTKALTIILA